MTLPYPQSTLCHRARNPCRSSAAAHHDRICKRTMASRRTRNLTSRPGTSRDLDELTTEDRDPFSDSNGDSDKNYESLESSLRGLSDDSSDYDIFDRRGRPSLPRLGSIDMQSSSSTSSLDENRQVNSDSDRTNVSNDSSESSGDEAGDQSNIRSFNQQQVVVAIHSENSHDSENLLSPNRHEPEQSGRNRIPAPGTPTYEDEWVDTVDDIPYFSFDSTLEGPSIQIDENSSVMDTFNQIVNENIIDYLVSCTNAYGANLCNKNRPHTRHSRNKKFTPTTTEEIKKFLALSFLHGHVRIPVARKLFTHDDPLYYHPIFTYVMSGRRYNQILRCFCAAESGAKGKLKVDKFANTLTQIFRDTYTPGRELSLDESLLLFRGRLQFRQYIKSKKARYGIKFYVLTSDDGYILNLIMYLGSDDVTATNGESGKKVHELVLRLMRPYLLKGHHLFMDNFYNSVTLSQKLLDLNTHTNGTLRTNRKDNPKELTEKKLKKGEHFWLRKKKVYVSKWKDKRPVLVLTTREHPEMIETQNRHGKKAMKPREVASYNDMSGIDRSDQMMSYYSLPRKTIRWYKKVLFHLLDMALWNSYYLFKKYVKKNGNYHFVTYREEVIKELMKLKKNLKGKDLVTRKKNDNRLYTNQLQTVPSVNIPHGHWPVRIEGPPTGKKKFSFLVCKVCAKKKLRRETSYRCEGCPETPALCPSCFREWHDNCVDVNATI